MAPPSVSTVWLFGAAGARKTTPALAQIPPMHKAHEQVPLPEQTPPLAGGHALRGGGAGSVSAAHHSILSIG